MVGHNKGQDDGHGSRSWHVHFSFLANVKQAAAITALPSGCVNRRKGRLLLQPDFHMGLLIGNVE